MAKSKSSFKARLLNSLALPMSWAFRLWYGTLRVHHDVADPTQDPRVTKAGAIYSTWHGDLFVNGCGFNFCGIGVMISNSTEGEFGTRIVQNMGYSAIRGSTGRGGARALREMIRAVAGTNVGITPDGPKGPARVVKDGAAYLASRTGMPLVAMGTAYSCATRFNSWDRMALAWPGSRSVVCLWPGLIVPRDANSEELERYGEQFQERMLLAHRRATELLAEWIQTGQRPSSTASQLHADLAPRLRKSA